MGGRDRFLNVPDQSYRARVDGGKRPLANAIVSDISDEKQRRSAMALVSACFSIAFTCGPILGAALSTIDMVASNKFAAAAGVSLLLVVADRLEIYFALPETHPQLRNLPGASDEPTATSNGHVKANWAGPFERTLQASDERTRKRQQSKGRWP